MLSRGVHAARRWDEKVFLPSEVNLKSRAESECPVGAVIYLKGDLAEFGTTLGFWTTASANFPCFLCDAKKDNLLCLEKWDAATHPFNRRTWESYKADCSKCEQWREISREQHVAIRGMLFLIGEKQAEDIL